MNKVQLRMSTAVAVLCFLLALPGGALGASSDTNTSAADLAARMTEYSASNEVLRAYIQFQSQIREAQVNIDRARREVEEASAQNALALSNRLQSIEQSLAAQRALESKTIDAMQSTGRFMLQAVSVFAGVAFVAIVLTAFFQWRAVNRIAEISGSIPAGRPMTPLASLPALGLSEHHLVTSSEGSGAGLLETIERLEHRLSDLEQATTPPLEEHPPEARASEKNGENGENGAHSEEAPAVSRPTPKEPAASEPAAGNKSLVSKGQSLLNEDKTEEAIACFDEALSQNPNDTDALVKKGAALEKLRKLPEAIECYDRAIALDNSLTIAYLHKGGLYNRMERFSEAVDCYEQALRTQEKRRAA
jgi:tetratricopeptide (TPR) repeat protein